jgi:uncharacterized SAM-binding protein YcdF (DUF218 family)
VLTVALFVGIGCGPIPALLLHDLQDSYSASAAVREASRTAIILLGNGTERSSGVDGIAVEPAPLAYGRIVKALEVYRSCKQRNPACFILVTGGDPQHHGASEGTVYGALLQRLGVESSDLLVEGRSLNTWQNAQYTAALLKSHPADQVFLVTSGIHLRRSVLYFNQFGIRGQPVRADEVSAMLSAVPLAYNFLLTDLAVHEYTGVVRYWVYEAMGWNVSAEKAGSV